MPDFAVPGDTGSITVQIENVGDTPTNHDAVTCINIWMSDDNGPGLAALNGGQDSSHVKIVDGLKDVNVANLAAHGGKENGDQDFADS